MKTILVDVMVDGRFYTQVRYTKKGQPMWVDGEVIEVHQTEDIEKYVLEHRPSLKGKNYQINFSNQRV